MTMFAKVLICINLAISLAMGTWAMGVYTNRVDWSDSKPKEGQPAGELTRKQTELSDLWSVWVPGDNSRRADQVQVVTLEAAQAGDRIFYTREMLHLWTDATEKSPARRVVFNGGRITLDAAGHPKLEPAKDRLDKPLLSLALYNEQEDKVVKELETVLTKYESLVNEDQRLTKLVIGPKGFQQRLIDERVKRAEVIAEHKLVRPDLINAVVESELILKRHAGLSRRVEELKKVKVVGRSR